MYVSYKQSQTVLCTFFIVVVAIPNQHTKCIAKDDTKAYTPFFFFLHAQYWTSQMKQFFGAVLQARGICHVFLRTYGISVIHTAPTS